MRKFQTRLIAILLLLVSVLGLVGCKDRAKLQLSPNSLTLKVGEVGNLAAQWNGEQTLIWSIDHPEIASLRVDESNLKATITGLRPGKTHVTAYVGNNEATAVINVEEKTTESRSRTLKIYNMNDLHGAYDTPDFNIKQLVTYLNHQRNADPDNVIVIAGGDMLQGSDYSTYTRGKFMIDMMNLAKFDVFTLGNHEFDWGLETLAPYFDNSAAEPKANFPLLGANVARHDGQALYDWIKPYHILDLNGLKVGVIGTIGEGLESSIAASKVKDYYFTSEVEAVKRYARYLRAEAGCEIVLFSSHSNTEYLNDTLASLTGDERIDAVFNGHTHRYYSGEIARPGVGLPYIQSAANGNYLGLITLYLKDNQVVQVSAENIRCSALGVAEDPEAHTLFQAYYDQYNAIFSEVYGVAYNDYGRNELAPIWARSLAEANSADIGVVNFGGIRASFYRGENITYGRTLDVMPFENQVRIASMPIKLFYDKSYNSGYDGNAFSNTMSFDGTAYYIGTKRYEANARIIVAVNEYVFDKGYGGFDQAELIKNGELNDRECFVALLKREPNLLR